MRGEQLEEENLSGLVTKTQSGFFTVKTPDGDVVCHISGRLKLPEKEPEKLSNDLVALGDYVTIEKQADGSGVIVSVKERRNVLSRVAPSSAVGTSAESEQIMIANCDQAIFVYAAAQPKPQPRMLDRLLVAAEKAELDSIVICVNKMDLVKQQKADKMFQAYANIDYTVLYISAKTGSNIDQLHAVLKEKISVFTGPSGVGKSSLLNTIQPGLKLQTSNVSDAHNKGRHTTRFSQLVPLAGGGYVADTPGIRAVAPWDVEPDELDSYFREIKPLVANCRFADCSHQHEPGCAVREAVEAGKVSEQRYDSYLRLREGLEEQYVY